MLEKFIYNTTGFHNGIPVEQLKSQYTLPGSQFLSINGMNVHFRVTGKGPALLLIHGIGSSMHTWKHYHDILSDSFTVISLDIPGFGLTGPAPRHQYSFEMYAQTFSGILDHLQFDTAFVGGNSLGGILTWQFARLHPKRVKKIVLLNAVGFNTKFNDLTDIGFMLAAHPATRKITYKLTPRRLIISALYNAVYNPNVVTEEKINLYCNLLMRKGNRESFSHIIRQIVVTNIDHTDQIRQIEQTALIIWGEEDRLIPVEDAFRFQRALKSSQLIIYKKIGHLPMEENPEISALDIKTFLQK